MYYTRNYVDEISSLLVLLFQLLLITFHTFIIPSRISGEEIIAGIMSCFCLLAPEAAATMPCKLRLRFSRSMAQLTRLFD